MKIESHRCKRYKKKNLGRGKKWKPNTKSKHHPHGAQKERVKQRWDERKREQKEDKEKEKHFVVSCLELHIDIS